MTNLMMNDWDLEAVIRGSWGGGVVAEEEPTTAMMWRDQRDFDFDFSLVEELEATATVLNELEELYKPFLILQPTPPYDGSTSASATTATSSLSYPTVDFNDGGGGDNDVDKPDVMMRHEVKVVADDEQLIKISSKSRCNKRKRKQDIKVVELGVEDVDGENLRNMDEWNWRKYGQKLIKGSPYPRSYYRCSSAGGCKARKQVERSVGFPYNYVVTYIGDHAHPLPARRRSFFPRKL